MPLNHIDALINAGWRVLESDFDEATFTEWRKEAFRCLTVLVGEDHAYTEHFRDCLKERNPASRSLLTEVGLLTAASLNASPH